MHQTCSLKKGSLHVKPTQNSKLKTAKSLALQLRSIWFPPWTPSAQTGSFLHLLSTCSLAMLPEPGATHPCQWQAAHQWPLTPGKGTASDPAELQTMGEQIANSKSREAPCLFSSCVVQAKLSLDLLESRLHHHLKTQILNPAKGLLVDQRCFFNTAW